MIILDTNVYVAYLNRRDEKHNRAKILVRQLLSGEFGSRFTISEVFSETATILFRKTKNLNIVQKAWDLIYSEEKAWGHVIIVNKDHIDKAWSFFQKYTTPKRPLSFVDCLLIGIAQELNIEKIISFDSEFDGILERIS